MDSNFVMSRNQVRAADRLAIEKYEIPSIVLMENAGRECVDVLLACGVSTTSPVCICCGKGSNGGDGFVMARHLEVRKVPVEVLIFHDPAQSSGDAALNYRILTHLDVPIHRLELPQDEPRLIKHFERASWIVDALLGTGATGAVREPYRTVIGRMNSSQRPIFSVDVPSGLDCDLGDPLDCSVSAKVTATLVALKPGFQSESGRQRVGEVHVVDVGIPRTVVLEAHGKLGVNGLG